MSGEPVNGIYSNFIVPQGINLRSERHLTLSRLTSALSATVVFLREMTTPASSLYRYDDWWEHDGLHLSRGPKDEVIGFDALASLVETPKALEAAMPGDDAVFIGIAPSDFRWYLRFYCDSAWMVSRTDTEATGRFDLTLPAIFENAYRRRVTNPLLLPMQAQEAIAYYQSLGMGSWREG